MKKQEFNFIIGILAILISVYPAFYITKSVQGVLQYIVPRIFSFFYYLPNLFLGIEPGWFDFISQGILIFVTTGFVYSFIAIFVPILVFEKLIKKKINWKPAIYILFFWFAISEYNSSIGNTLNQGLQISLGVTEWLAIIFREIGVFGTLFAASVYVKRNQ